MALFSHLHPHALQATVRELSVRVQKLFDNNFESGFRDFIELIRDESRCECQALAGVVVVITVVIWRAGGAAQRPYAMKRPLYIQGVFRWCLWSVKFAQGTRFHNGR